MEAAGPLPGSGIVGRWKGPVRRQACRMRICLPCRLLDLAPYRNRMHSGYRYVSPRLAALVALIMTMIMKIIAPIESGKTSRNPRPRVMSDSTTAMALISSHVSWKFSDSVAFAWTRGDLVP